MEVLLKTGRYAGEVKDVRADIAADMIKDGRAEDPRLAEVPAERRGVSPGIFTSGNPLARTPRGKRS